MPLLIFFCLLMGWPLHAFAWSSGASRTYHEIHQLHLSIQLFEADFHRYPKGDQWWTELRDYWPYISENGQPSGPPKDRFGYPLVYRQPGLHGPFDLYSMGPDGIDNGGLNDDISLWAGVNDGFHWKSTWPLGRRTLLGACFLAVAVCCLSRWLRWTLMLPIAGLVLSTGIAMGCNWLMHPGRGADRNTLLGACIFFSFCLALFSLALFLIAYFKNRAFFVDRKNHQ